MVPFALAALVALLGQTQPTAEGAPDRSFLETIAQAIGRMDRAAAEARDYTCVFHKREYKGEQLPGEVIRLKLRTSPRGVYMKWLDDGAKDREVIWQPDRNGGKLRAHKGSFPDITVSLSPDSSTAMKTSRHPISLVGFAGTTGFFVRDVELLRKQPACLKSARDLGFQTVHGARSRCFEMETDKAACPGVYGYKSQLCIHAQLGLPTRVMVWDLEDGKIRLVEEYGYEDIRVNVGLTDEDFNPDNPFYDF